MGYDIDCERGATLPEDYLLMSFVYPERALPQYKNGMTDAERSEVRTQRSSLIAARAQGLDVVSRGMYPRFSALCQET